MERGWVISMPISQKLSNFVKNERINLVPYTLLNFHNYFDHVLGSKLEMMVLTNCI